MQIEKESEVKMEIQRGNVASVPPEQSDWPSASVKRQEEEEEEEKISEEQIQATEIPWQLDRDEGRHRLDPRVLREPDSCPSDSCPSDSCPSAGCGTKQQFIAPEQRGCRGSCLTRD
ncbi:unnamed protein product [Pleuronectes platessa]|uniref:Uncharacterized protein n=1 Tax=Pleuronectes platessa TaxID=8262 RepID=A0A9N7Z1D1_PLEPL|nr:unnamed protein product [Pleuronectes platessa]